METTSTSTKTDSKELLSSAAQQYATYLVDSMPQTEDGQVRYYISGSLAMLLLSNATSIQRMQLREDKTSPSGFAARDIGKQVEVGQAQRDALTEASRTLHDVDVITVGGFTQSKDDVKKTTVRSVVENCDKATALFPAFKTIKGNYYFDTLSEERSFKQHDMALITLNNGAQVYIADPLSLIIHKFADTCNYAGQLGNAFADKQYAKDLVDLQALMNGLMPLYTSGNSQEDNVELFTRLIKQNADNAEDSYLTTMIKGGTNAKLQEALDLIHEECGCLLVNKPAQNAMDGLLSALNEQILQNSDEEVLE